MPPWPQGLQVCMRQRSSTWNPFSAGLWKLEKCLSISHADRTFMSVVVIVSANAEWESLKPMFRPAQIEQSPFGEYFFGGVAGGLRTLFFHGGWGKVAAGASTQYVIDHFKPRFLINLGTCGGIEGRVGRFDVVAAERTMIYDIHEAMEESHVGIAHYTTDLAVPA